MKKIISVFLSLVMVLGMLSGLSLTATADVEMANLFVGTSAFGADEKIAFTYHITVDGEKLNASATGDLGEYEIKEGTLVLPSTDYARIELPVGASYTIYREKLERENFATIEATDPITDTMRSNKVYLETAGNLSVDIGDNSFGGIPKEITKEEYDEATNNGTNPVAVYFFYYKDRTHNDLNTRRTIDEVEACTPITLSSGNIYRLKSEPKNYRWANLTLTAEYSSTGIGDKITLHSIKGAANATISGNEKPQEYIVPSGRSLDQLKANAAAMAKAAMKTAIINCANGAFKDEGKSVSTTTDLDSLVTVDNFANVETTNGTNLMKVKTLDLFEFSPYISVTYTYSTEQDDSVNVVMFDADLHVHDYKTSVTAPTCIAQGYTTHTCDCGDTYRDSYTSVNPSAHARTKATLTPAKLNADGQVTYTCEDCSKVLSSSTIYKPASFTLSATKYTYDGKEKKPTVTVKDSKGNIIPDSNYEVTYSNNKKNGKATATVTFHGNYSGKKDLYFTIKPKGTSITKLTTAGKKAMTIKWKRQTKDTTGYQIQYSTSKKFKSAKTITIKKNSKTSQTIKKLKGKKYYVRIRVYKQVGKTKYCSSWSKTKSIKIKK